MKDYRTNYLLGQDKDPMNCLVGQEEEDIQLRWSVSTKDHMPQPEGMGAQKNIPILSK